MFNYKRIAIGFGLVICLMIALGSVSLYQMRNIASDVNNIYRHPFTVSNAAKNIDFHLVSMHRYMKDVVLSENKEQLDVAISKVTQHEVKILQDFRIIAERYLGDKSQINDTYQLFIEWKPIRDEVISLVRNGEIYEAGLITKTRGAAHVHKLNTEVNKLVAFALNKADEFKQRAEKKKKKALTHIFILTMMAVVLAIVIAVYVIRNALAVHKERVQRIHLIDQNIMMSRLDTEGVVIDVSNALCRFLENTKDELIGKPSNFFDNSDEAEMTINAILRTVKTGQNWKGEIKRIDQDGHVHWANSSIIPNYDDDFQLTGFTNILVDTTSKKLSITDNLTTLYNRRRYEEILPREIRMAKRNDSSVTLAIVDIDYFKKYNDRYGHPQGDKILSQVAERLLKSLKRPNDFVFRIGGEEFAVLFSALNKEQSDLFLSELREAVENLQIPHADSKVSEYLTISVGAHVTYPETDMNDEQLYAMADKALYMAKAKRNTVVVTS